MMKKLLVVATGFIILQLGVSAMPAKAKKEIKKTEDKIAAAENRIKANKQYEKKLVEVLFKTADEIKNYANKVRRADLNLGGLSGLGNVEQMKIKAERYAIEKKSRKKLQADFEKLYQALQDWKLVKQKIKDDEDIVKLRDLIEKLEKQRAMADPLKTMKQENFQWYTLKEPATLQEISSFSEVLSDASKWQDIYEANLNVMKELGYDRPNPDIEIPTGINLKIPNQPEMFIDTPDVVQATAKSSKSKMLPEKSTQKQPEAPEKKQEKPAKREKTQKKDVTKK